MAAMESQNVVVRRAETKDLETVASLGTRTFVEAFRDQVPAGELSRYVEQAFSREQLRSEFAAGGSTFLLAERGEVVLGYARLLAEDSPAIRGEPGLRIVRMYVEQELVRSGVGSALMRASIDRAVSDRSNLWLRVWEHNRAAIAFYERWDFRKALEIDFEMLGSMKKDWVMQRDVKELE
jgi:ribosomal protein S18 acetylase RimI-like enzyme